MNDSLLQQRLILFRLIVFVAFAILTAKLWDLQILGGEGYRALSRDNRIDLQTVPAPRGVIYDRQGQILVRNRPTFRATMQAAHVIEQPWGAWSDADFETAATRLQGMAAALRMPFPHADPPAALRDAFERASGRLLVESIGQLCQEDRLLDCYAEGLLTAPYQTITVRLDLPRDVALMALENSSSLPGLAIVSESQREYLYGDLYAHILGYELPIPQYILDEQTRFSSNPYLPTDRVGMAGLEQGFEEELRGVRGVRLVEQNVIGRQLRVAQEQSPQPGHNLFLTIDTELQNAVSQALKSGMAAADAEEGVAIAMDPRSGEILAMVSLPSYDNNTFAGNIDPVAFQQLSENPTKPMFNRAISGVYPPGSTFKIIPAAGTLADGVINRQTTVFDPGVIYLPNKFAPDDPDLAQPFVCWLDRGHGEQNVVDALAHSCDVFFYIVSGGYLEEFQGLGEEALAKWAVAFGLGEPTRIRLPGESAGHVPTRQWKRLSKQESWVTGDTYNMSIGQGDVLTTPLQMVNATAAIANGGTIYEPQLVYQIQDADGQVTSAFEPRVLRSVNAPPEVLSIVAEGMRGAVAWETGTANLVFRDMAVEVAGKTGTAEYCAEVIELDDGRLDCLRDSEGNLLTHAWFTAFAPYNAPEIALVVFVHGNKETVIQGSEVAAPIARQILDYYFTREPVVPLPLPERTPEEPATPPTATPAPAPAPAPLATTVPAATPVPPKVEPTLPAAVPTPALPPGMGRFDGALLRTEPYAGEFSVVSGRVVDRIGNPQRGVLITLDGGGAPVASLTTGPDGSFRYDLLNPDQAATWFVRAPGLEGSPVLALSVGSSSHFIVLFQESQ